MRQRLLWKLERKEMAVVKSFLTYQIKCVECLAIVQVGRKFSSSKYFYKYFFAAHFYLSVLLQSSIRQLEIESESRKRKG